MTSTATPSTTGTGVPTSISSTPRQPIRTAYATNTTASTNAVCLAFISGEVHEVLETHGQARRAADPPDAEEHAGHERDPRHRVVPDRQRLALVAEQHLLVRDQ